MKLSAGKLGYRALNEMIRQTDGEITVEHCFGERFIGCGASGKKITIQGTPGNALGAYLDGASIVVHGNVQDAAGDTMNDGEIIIHGNAGDALGYAMRGGRIFVRDDAGYRTGIHMKQYNEKKPVIVAGGSAGSFLGEYLAGGLIIVLGLHTEEIPAGNFIGTGMHGGEIFLRSKNTPKHLPKQVGVRQAEQQDLLRIKEILIAFANTFKIEMDEIWNKPFQLLTPNAKNPYQQLYTEN